MSQKLRTQSTSFRVHLGVYVVFILAYLAGALDFALEYHNYWACGGFALVLPLIGLHMAYYIIPDYKIYRLMPPGSFWRVAHQTFFLLCCLAAIGMGFWMMARAIEENNDFTGDSYYCAMTGIWMSAKWFYFVTIPIKNIREDTLDEESLVILGLLEPLHEAYQAKNEPIMGEKE